MKENNEKTLWIIGAVLVFAVVVIGMFMIVFSPLPRNRPSNKIKICMVCTSCDTDGYLLDSKNNNYCPRCGKHFSECKIDMSDNRTYVMYECPYCKKITSTNLQFCSKCGHNLEKTNKYICENLQYLYKH